MRLTFFSVGLVLYLILTMSAVSADVENAHPSQGAIQAAVITPQSPTGSTQLRLLTIDPARVAPNVVRFQVTLRDGPLLVRLRRHIEEARRHTADRPLLASQPVNSHERIEEGFLERAPAAMDREIPGITPTTTQTATVRVFHDAGFALSRLAHFGEQPKFAWGGYARVRWPDRANPTRVVVAAPVREAHNEEEHVPLVLILIEVPF